VYLGGDAFWECGEDVEVGFPHQPVCVCVCVCVCVYVCMYVCMYVYVYVLCITSQKNTKV
jgi:hypothetical protein